MSEVSTDRRAARRAVRRAAVVLVALGAVLALVAPAAADGSAGQRIADQLRGNPVHVDPVYEPALPPARQAALAARIEETGLPLHVVLVPVVEGDDWNGDSRVMAEVVRDQLGLGPGDPGIVVVLGDAVGTRHLTAYEWPDDTHQARSAARAVGFQPDMREAALGDRLERVVELIASGTGDQAYEEATADLGAGRPSPEEDDAAGQEGGGFPLAAVLLGTVPLLAVAVTGWLLLRRRGVLGSARYRTPRTVLAAARENEEAGLRARARRELVEFGEELTGLEENGDTDPARLRAALDSYAAAGTVADRARSVPDLAGVLALLAEGRAALRPGTARPRRPCFFHPLHGDTARRVRWRPMGRTAMLKVPACDACADAVRGHLPPEVLTDRHEGRDVPYFEVPADRSLWAATGYGALGGDSLTARVRRGDFTRTLR